MRIQISIIFFLTSIFCYSQGFIKDKDGYVNVRDTYKFKESKVIDTLHNNHLVWIQDEIENWYVIWSLMNENRNGYVHKSRIVEFDQNNDFEIKKVNENKLSLYNDGIKILVERQNFNESEYDSDNSFGTDGNLPKFEYKSIEVNFQNKKLILTNNDYLKNLYEPNVDDLQVYFDKYNDNLYISSLNSDGAGAYVVIWVIDKIGNIDRITTIPF